MSHQEHIDDLLMKIQREKTKPRQQAELRTGDGLIRYGLNKLSEYKYKPKGWKKPDISVPYPVGMPPKPVVIKLVEASYAKTPPAEIDGWSLIRSSPTVKFYKKLNTIIVAIRGTADLRDVSSWYNIANGTLNSTGRVKEDEAEISMMKKQYPTAQFYGVGHSAGGSSLDVMIAKGYIISGVSYNPAVEKQYFNSTKNYRIYMENDPLYNLIGKYAKLGEVRKQRSTSGLDTVAGVQSVKAHLLSNFVGGARVRPVLNFNELRLLSKTKQQVEQYLNNELDINPINKVQEYLLDDFEEPADDDGDFYFVPASKENSVIHINITHPEFTDEKISDLYNWLNN